VTGSGSQRPRYARRPSLRAAGGMRTYLGLDRFAGLALLRVDGTARLVYRWLQVVIGPVSQCRKQELHSKSCAASGLQATSPATLLEVH
jgi:hypothetical protein